MSDDMVERVARTLCEECAMEPFDALSRSKYIGDARVVIAAMREPTQAMIDACDSTDGMLTSIWQAMIDAVEG